MFLIATGIVTMICCPYIYYTGVVYMYIQDNANAQAGPGFDMRPSYRDFWITVNSAFAVFLAK